jgi:hypothetical protein
LILASRRCHFEPGANPGEESASPAPRTADHFKTTKSHDASRGVFLFVFFYYPFESAQIHGEKLVSSPARPATSAIPAATTRPAAASTASTIPPTAAARTSTASTTVSAMWPISLRTVASTHRRSAFAIKVRLIIGEITAAFNHHRAGQRGRRNRLRFWAAVTVDWSCSLAPAHLGALLFQNRLAR